ncbi:RcnB family protein [Erwinia sp. P7711]|uniref:RcnB family protein n=1 Tax=Erwinia sp. P7711 TaxID=3141451 RepID=UPI00319D7584
MSKSKIVLLSAVLLSALPAMSTAYAEGEQAPQVQTTEGQDPAAQPQAAPAPDADPTGEAPDATTQGVTTPGQTPDVQSPAEKRLDVPEKPDPAHPYAIKTFFADFQRFNIGSVVPDRYRTKKYEIVDWKTRNLPKPAEGTNWTYMGGNYVLISKADGKILQAESGDIFYHQ